jgi:hypothetical protein
MNYEIKGHIRHDYESDYATHSTEYTDYNDAVNHYISIYSGVAADIAQTGGDFVISLIQWNDDNTLVILKRHTLNTTVV